MKKYCLTLRERPERTELARQEFAKMNLNFEFHYGIKTADGRIGCRLGQLEMMKKQKKGELLFLAEDDILFLEPISTLAKCLKQLPKDFGALWLGSTLNEDLERYSDNLFILKKGWATQGVIYNPDSGILDEAIRRGESSYKVDVMLAELQEEFKCFVTYPMVATQKPSYSDIIHRYTDYSIIRERYDLHTKG